MKMGSLTYTAKSLGALVMFPVGERDLEMCSNEKAVGKIAIDSRTTRYP